MPPLNGCTPPPHSGVVAPNAFHRVASFWTMLVAFAGESVRPNQTASELPSCGFRLLFGLSRYIPALESQRRALAARAGPGAGCVAPGGGPRARRSRGRGGPAGPARPRPGAILLKFSVRGY